MCDQQRLCFTLEYSTSVMLLTEHHLEFLSLKGGCTDSSESIHVKMPHCWKSHVAAQLGFLEKTEFCCIRDSSGDMVFKTFGPRSDMTKRCLYVF